MYLIDKYADQNGKLKNHFKELFYIIFNENISRNMHPSKDNFELSRLQIIARNNAPWILAIFT